MNINIFFSVVTIGLFMIYFIFKPMNLKETKDKEIAQFTLGKFTLNELDKEGLATKMHGDKAIRYTNRYEVYNIDFTDNSKDYLTNMKAQKGSYKRDIVYLSGDVKLKRDDGFRFFSQKAKYDKKNDIASTNTDYVAYMGDNYIKGSSAIINNKKSTVSSKNIYAKYNLEQEKKK